MRFFGAIYLIVRKLFQKLFTLLKKEKGSKPIVPIHHDLALLRRIRNKKFPSWLQIKHIKKILSPREWVLFQIGVTILTISSFWIILLGINVFRVEIPTVGGIYTEAVIGEPQRINPLFSSVNPVDQDITSLVFSGLMRYGADQELIPDVAESYTISEDKKTYTFVLRKGVMWHDQTPLTARDVVFTFDLIQDIQVNSPLRVSFDGVVVRALDDQTVSFTLKDPFNPFLASLTVGLLPEHIWFDVDPVRISLAKQNLQPVGSGPFVFKKLAKDEAGFIYQYELKRNKTFYRTPPYLEEFIFKFFAEYDGPAGAITALREQRVDGLSFVPYVLRDKVVRKYINLTTLRLPQYTALFFNQDHKKTLEDKTIRTALAQAIDKDRIIKHALSGEAEVINSPILSGFIGYNADLAGVAYEASKSNEILDKDWKRVSADEYRESRKKSLLEQWDEANPAPELQKFVEGEPIEGEINPTQEEVDSNNQKALATYQENKKNAESEIDATLTIEFGTAQTFYRKNSAGEILALTITTLDTEEYKKASQTIAGLWREIGVQVNIIYVPQQQLKRETIKNRDYDVLLFGLIIGNDPDQYPFWHSSQIEFPGLNISRYVNRALDGILEKAQGESDQEALEKLYTEFQTILLQENPAVFLYTPTYTYAVLDHILGITADRIFAPSDRFTNVTDWYIKTKRVWKGKS